MERTVLVMRNQRILASGMRLVVAGMLAVMALSPAVAVADSSPTGGDNDGVADTEYDCRQSAVIAPSFTCVDGGLFSMWIPDAWHLVALAPAGRSYLIQPDGLDGSVRLTIEVQEDGRTIVPDDVPALTKIFEAGIVVAPGTQVEWQARWRSGDLLTFDAKYSALAGDKEMQRRVRQIYHGTKQYMLTAEGPSSLAEDIYQPMFLAGSPALTYNAFEKMFRAMLMTFRPLDPAGELPASVSTYADCTF